MYGSLKRAKGNALISDLNRAIVYINGQKNKDAINRLNTFINNVKALIKSHSLLTPEENEKAQQMIVTTNEIIAQLKGTKSGDEEYIITDVDTQSNQDIITETKLGTIYPNPSKERITINYEIAENEQGSEKVTIQIYDVIGRLVSNLVNKNLVPGRYTATWNGSFDNGELASRGFYFIRLSAGKTNEVKRIVLDR
jgi:hypothetical protein